MSPLAKIGLPFLALLVTAGISPAGAQTAELDLARGIALLSRGDGRGAEKLFRRALEKNPGDGRLLTFLGQALLVAEDFSGAAETLRLALHGGQAPDEVRLDLAAALIKCGRPAEAEEALVKAGEDLRQRASWHYYLGYSRYLQENFSAALEPLEKALALDQGFAAAAGYYLGLAQAREGRSDLAQQLFRQVAESAAAPGQLQALARRNLELLESGEAKAPGRNWSLFAMVGGGYDTNVLLDPRLPGAAGSPTALLAAGGLYRPELGANDRLQVGGKIFRSFHTTSRTRGYDLTDVQAMAGWEHGFGGGHLFRAAYSGQAQFLDGTEDLGLEKFGLYKHAHGLNGDIVLRVGRRAATRIGYLFEASLFHGKLDVRDNFHHELALGQKVLLLEGKYILDFSAGLFWEDARHIYYDLWGPRAGLDIGWRASIFELRLQAGWWWERYLDIDRSDHRIAAGASASVRLGRNLSLGAGWEFTDNLSNFDEFSYRRHLFSLTLLARL